MRFAIRQVLALAVLAVAGTMACGADWYVAPDGRAGNAGLADQPWDIASALVQAKVQPGDTILLKAGTYRRRPQELFEVRLAGADGKPITVRPADAARATIDGGLAVQAPSAHVIIRDLEVLVSEPRPDKPTSAGSSPSDLGRPWGGMHMHGGKNCRYVNLVIHDCCQGISCWKGETDCEIYGCLVYENGWLGVDRGHGHCIYTQNKDGVKRIENCIFTCKYPGSYTMHAYGSSRADVDNYVLERNIAYGLGPFLIGGGRPSNHIRVANNYLYSVGMQLGYNAPQNEDCEVRDNYIVNGSLSINKFKKVINEGNLVLAKGSARPAGSKCVLLPNRYDPKRAHLAVFNFAGQKTVNVPAGDFLKDGEKFALKNPKDFFGKAVAEGACANGKITVPVEGEFAAYVVIKR